MFELQELAPATYILPKSGSMRVPGLVIGDKSAWQDPDMIKPLEQVANVATLPGILGYSIAMPDIHWGYGFPIGGVAAMDIDTGVISPGGVGYDINCGVRVALVPILYSSLTDTQKTKLLEQVFCYVPSGVGHGSRGHGLTNKDYLALTRDGVAWSIALGYGFPEDIDHIESKGYLSGADLQTVSALAKKRGANQLGSIGSGNHFVEIGTIETIYLPQVAEAWGVIQGYTYILIHSGSRGFGHQICQDTLDEFITAGFAKDLPDKQLVAAPLKSAYGVKYFSAMACAANFAFNNRQQILHHVRQAFTDILGLPQASIRLLYDVCHNIAKKEQHIIEGKPHEVCVHRKGATRAFGPNHPELTPLFQITGQPVLVPGDMGRGSHIMVGQGNPLTFCSCCHGAGRAKSRMRSLRDWQAHNPKRYMQDQGVLVKASSNRTLLEEMPDAYKEVDHVVQEAEKAGLAKRVARLKPGLVIKG